MRIAMVGTDLAPLLAGSGALERAALAWADGLARLGHEVALVDASPGGPVREEIERLSPEVVVLNNRPAWAHLVGEGRAVLHILHNYDDAWSTEAVGARRYEEALARPKSTVLCVSAALAGHVASTFSPRGGVGVAIVPVEQCFLSASWSGSEGSVLFPNRLLEKKGVRFFLQLAGVLAARGLSSRMYCHTAPFPEPTPEQQALIELASASPHVELLEPPAGREEMAASYAAAGVVVCPSIRREGLGLVALEAQAVGAPVVTSGLGGLREITFSPNEVVSNFDVEAWAGAVERALRRAPDRNPPRQVASLYNPQEAVSSLLTAIGRLVTEGLGGDR